MSQPIDDSALFGMVRLPPVASVRARLISRRLRLAGGDGRPLHMVATGRTGSGKTTLGNRLLGIDYFLSNGGQDCTKEVNHIRFPGRLLYSDLPGVCSDDLLENFNRAALGLAQVDEFPTVQVLTVATYSGDRPPDRRDHPVDRFPAAHPPPDLLLYVVAADKQFTSSDRRYLADLLAHHRRVLYVLNVFATSIPTRANIWDVVGRIAAIHRSVRGESPSIVTIDCRSGDGLADLLAASREILDADHGQLLTDLIADQERDTPAVFTADMHRHLIKVAASASALPAGPPGSEHPIHRLAVGLWSSVDALRNWVDAGDAGSIALYGPTVVEAVGSAGGPSVDHGESLLDLARKLAEIPDQLSSQRNLIREGIVAALGEWQAEVARGEAEVLDAEAAMMAAGADLPTHREELDGLDDEFTRRQADLEATGRDLQLRSATFEHETHRLQLELDAFDDQLEDFNDTVRRKNAAGGFDPESRVIVDRMGDGLNRRRDGLARRVESSDRVRDRFNLDVRRHHAEVDRFNSDLDRHRKRWDAFRSLVETYRARRGEWHRARRAHDRRATAFQWAKQRCLSSFYPAEAELSARVDEFRDRIRSTFRRVAAASETENTPGRFLRLEAGLRGATADLQARINVLRSQFAQLRLDRECDRLLARHTSDHFDDQGDGGHRGSTYTLLGADAVAIVFAAVHAGATGDNSLTVLDNLAERYRTAVGELPTAIADEVTAHLNSRPDLICPEFELALARLVFVADQAVVGER